MTRRSVETIIQTLNEAGVRYLIAGGLAVVAHGYVRFTADLDLVLDLAPENVKRTIQALDTLGYTPRAPVAFTERSDPEKRRQWGRDKNIIVFSLYSTSHPATEIDIFVEPPLDFEAAYQAAARMEIAPGVEAVFVGYDDLLRLKAHAGRPVDLEDIRQLKAVHDDAGE